MFNRLLVAQITSSLWPLSSSFKALSLALGIWAELVLAFFLENPFHLRRLVVLCTSHQKRQEWELLSAQPSDTVSVLGRN